VVAELWHLRRFSEGKSRMLWQINLHLVMSASNAHVDHEASVISCLDHQMA
jgi:hypothetical protein